MTLIGGIEDQISLYVWGEISNKLFTINDPSIANFYVYQRIFRSLITPLKSNQPLMWLFYSIFGSIFGGNFINIFFILTFILTFFVSYQYFKKYNYPIIFSFLFSFSTYFLTHLGRHVALVQIWFIPLLFLIVENKNHKFFKKSLLTSIVLACSFLTSNYLGFFLILTFLVYKIISFFMGKISTNKLLFSVKEVFTVLTATAVIVVYSALPYVKAIYFPSPDNSVQLPKAKKTISEFVTFSSRPWYFFIPSVKNPFLGNASKNIISKLESTEYFLADDYFPAEHQANFFGVVFLISVLYFSIFIHKEGNKSINKEVKTLLVLSIILASFILPPFFTISGLKIYTPNWLVFKFLPMFRVMARLSVVIHFVLLAILAKSLSYIKDNDLIEKQYVKLTIIFLFIVTIFETYIPIKIYNIPKTPEVFEYLGNKNISHKVAVYPYSKADDVYLWLPIHKQLIINLRHYRDENYDSELLTKDIPSENGINLLKELEVEYIIVGSESKTNFFKESDALEIEKEFGDYTLVKII